MQATNAAVTSPRRSGGASSFNSCCALMKARPWPAPAASEPSASNASECAGDAATSSPRPIASTASPRACGGLPAETSVRAAICDAQDATTDSAATVDNSATFFVSSRSPA